MKTTVVRRRIGVEIIARHKASAEPDLGGEPALNTEALVGRWLVYRGCDQEKDRERGTGNDEKREQTAG